MSSAKNRRQEQIARDAAAADAALRSIAEGKDPAPVLEGSEGAPTPAPAAAGNDPAPLPAQGDNVVDLHGTPRNPAPVKDEATPPASAPESGDGDGKESRAVGVDAKQFAKLEQRFRTLEGMYQSTKSELDQVRGQNQALQNLLAKRDNLPREDGEPAAPKAAPKAQQYQPFTEAERKEWDDVIPLVERAAGLALQAPLNSLIDRLVKVEQQLAGLGSQTKQVAQQVQTQKLSQFEVELGKLVPDYLEINTDPEFLDWLNKPAKFSARPKAADLTDFFQQGNVAKVAEFFNAWKEETGRMPAAQAPAPQAEPSRPAHDVAQSLVAPTPAASGRPASQPGPKGRIWTTAEVDKVYDDYAKKRITREQFSAIEADIQKAAMEGRLKG